MYHLFFNDKGISSFFVDKRVWTKKRVFSATSERSQHQIFFLLHFFAFAFFCFNKMFQVIQRQEITIFFKPVKRWDWKNEEEKKKKKDLVLFRVSQLNAIQPLAITHWNVGQSFSAIHLIYLYSFYAAIIRGYMLSTMKGQHIEWMNGRVTEIH